MRKSSLALAVLLYGVAVQAQTRLDLQNQAKQVDFSAASSTRPFKTGTSLPATCQTGEMYFKTNEPSGQNLYGCVAANTWALEAGSGGGSGTGAVTVQSAGTPVGTRSTINFEAGSGILTSISDDGTAVSVQHSLNTAVVQTLAHDQSGASLLCVSNGGSDTAYTCSMTPSLTIYTNGMMLRWKPDVNGAGGATTLNVDTLGARAVKLADGITDPSPAEIIAGQILQVWYDGTLFRLTAGGAPSGSSRPACTVETRGRFWFSPGGAGVKDDLSICAKDAAGNYSWRLLY